MEEARDQESPTFSYYMELYIGGMSIRNSSKSSCAEPILNLGMKSSLDPENFIASLVQRLTKLRCAGHFHVLINMVELEKQMKER